MPSAPAAAGGISPLDFEQKVTMNVEHVISRVKGIAPLYSDKVLYYHHQYCFKDTACC